MSLVKLCRINQFTDLAFFLRRFPSAVFIGAQDHAHAHQSAVELRDIFRNVQKIDLILKAYMYEESIKR